VAAEAAPGPEHEDADAVLAPLVRGPARGATVREGATPRQPSLQVEQDLVEMARAALARGNAGVSLDALDRHAREHPRGRLAQEREVLAIVALAKLGRAADASARAARFRSRWPQSFLLPAVDRASPPNP
jgi:hypothetical protein